MRPLAAMLLVLTFTAPAFAVTAGHVLDRMSAEERAGYITGAVELAMVSTTPERAGCINGWFYTEDGKAQRSIVTAMGQYRDRSAAAIINALIVKACGK